MQLLQLNSLTKRKSLLLIDLRSRTGPIIDLQLQFMGLKDLLDFDF